MGKTVKKEFVDPLS
jgi:hypothetical protein